MTTDVLFVHNNFPGQFGFIARALMEKGARVAAIASHTGKGIDGVPIARWTLKRGTAKDIFPDAVRAEADLMRGRAAADCALKLRENGFNPKAIVGHPGWGEMIYMREIWPHAKQVHYGEYYYRSKGGDVGFDHEFGVPTEADLLRVHPKNATQILQYSEADYIISPTPFQANRFPKLLKPMIRIIHEGVDVDMVKPDPDARLTLPNGRELTRGDQVITLINRRFEPMRGYHIFMRALPEVMRALPEAQVVLIGADEPGGYGKPAPRGTTWGKVFLDEVRGGIDESRLHFMGTVPHPVMLSALAISSAHAYYTYPFVLSWSLLEAMASECAIIASDTAPVRDALTDGVNARLLDFFDPKALADTIIETVRNPDSMAAMRKAARQSAIAEWDRKRICEPAWVRLMAEVLDWPMTAGVVVKPKAPARPNLPGKKKRRR